MQWFSQKKYYLILPLIITAIVVYFITSYLVFNHYLENLTDNEQIQFIQPVFSNARKLLLAFLGFNVLVLGIILFFVRKSIIKPLREAIKIGNVFTESDCNALLSAMTELSQGNMAAKLAVQSKSIPISQVMMKNPFIDILNKMIESLHRTAHEFNGITDLPLLRLCFVGGDTYIQGQQCAEAMAKEIGDKGKVAITTGYFNSSGLELRRKGFINYMHAHFPQISIVDIQENLEDPEKAYQHTNEFLKKYPQLSGIYVTEGATPQGVARAIIDNDKVGEVKIIAHDLTAETMRYVIEGVISATGGDNPFAQGHDPVIHLYNYLMNDWRPTTPRLLIDMVMVDKKNYHNYWIPGEGIIQSDLINAKLARHANKVSEKPLRIAVLGREDSSFWFPIKRGVHMAGEELKPLNVTVEWFVPQGDTISADAFGPILEKFIKDKYDGIATIVTDRKLIPYINQAVENGIPVITFTTEPTSLRNLIFTIRDQADKLMELSQNLAASVYEVNAATAQINNTMSRMAKGTITQNAQVNRTYQILESLLNDIERVNSEAVESSRASEETAKSISSGTEAMQNILESTRTVEGSVSNTWEVVEDLNKHSQRIDMIVELIDDIASRVNVLALNAAIEATKAGEYGEGFMVVATEIRKLARKTGEATKEVTERVNAVQGGTAKVAKVMAAGLGKLKESSEMTDKANDALKTLRMQIETNQVRIQNIADAINDMQKLSQQVEEAMENVTSVSKSNAESVEEVNASTNSVSNRLEDVAHLALFMEDMAQTEQSLLAKFNLENKE